MTLKNKILQALQKYENIELVNAGQGDFEIYIENNKRHLKFKETKNRLWCKWYEVVFNWGYDMDNREPVEQLPSPLLLHLMKHCIRVLPEFDVPNPEYKKWLDNQSWNGDLISEIISCKEQIQYACYKYLVDDLEEILNRNCPAPKTIRQAFLQSGAMTVEELEEEYKKLNK